MSTKGIIIAGESAELLKRPELSKAVMLVYGKPLIIHTICHFREQGVKEVYVFTRDDRTSIEQVIKQHKIDDIEILFRERTQMENALYDVAQTLANDFPDENKYIITSLDQFFEDNPFKSIKCNGDIELLVDKQVQLNKFGGATIHAKIRLGSLINIGSDIPSYNTFALNIMCCTSKGLELIISTTKKGDARSEALIKLQKARLLKVTNLKKMMWCEVRTPALLMQAEMIARSKTKEKRPSTIKAETLIDRPHSLSFHYEKSQDTKVTIQSGILYELGSISLMKPDRFPSRHVIITDTKVDKLFGDTVLNQMKKAGFLVDKFVVPEGEGAKQISVYQNLAEKIIAHGIDEKSIIFALGGGVVANISGFLAATLYRGIGLIHIPTTFMNMVDVSISLKQGINSQKGKNLVGSYYQPLRVYIDPEINMPDELVQHGIAESIKHAIGQDDVFFDYLLAYKGPLDDKIFRERVIRRTIELKIELMNDDMFENRQGIILQYGHEIGHALEFLSGFELKHGEAVSIGMRVSAELAHLMNVSDQTTVDRHIEILKHYNLPFSIPANIDGKDIVNLLRFNKKTMGQDIRFALMERIGKVWKIKGEFGIPIQPELIMQAINKSYKK